MKLSGEFEFPQRKQADLRRAHRLEWISIAYLSSVAVLMYLVMGSSQAMKTAWAEDCLSLVPPIVFLIAARVRKWPPNDRHPYGYHRAVGIAFLCAALALLAVGLLLVYDAAHTLIAREHPTIGTVVPPLWGRPVWLGWLMLPVLFYSAAPAVILGYLKHRPARELHDKTLYADADMNKADWMTAAAAMLGVLGIGMGFWWADSVAALAISTSVLRDGFKHTRTVIADLMDRTPMTTDHGAMEPHPEMVRQAMRRLDWVADAKVRLRENGHVFFGEIYILPTSGAADVHQVRQARETADELDWRLHDLTVSIVSEEDFNDPPGRDGQHGGGDKEQRDQRH